MTRMTLGREQWKNNKFNPTFREFQSKQAVYFLSNNLRMDKLKEQSLSDWAIFIMKSTFRQKQVVYHG